MSNLYEFTYAKNDRQAEGHIKKYGIPDLVVVDIDNRDLSDVDYLKEINRRMSSIVPVIILGSYQDVNTIRMLKDIGISSYILKPYSLVYLINEMKRSIINGEL